MTPEQIANWNDMVDHMAALRQKAQQTDFYDGGQHETKTME